MVGPMSALATSTLALAVVYAAIGSHALLMGAGGQHNRVVRAFGMLCLSVSTFTVGSAMLIEAATVAASAQAQSLQLVAGSFATGFYIAFARELHGGAHRLALGFGYALPACAVVLGLAGALTTHEGVTPDRSFGAGPGLQWAELTLAGKLTEAGILVGACLALLLAYRGRDRHRLRPPVWAPIAVVLGVLFDLWAEHSHIDTIFVSEYVFLFMAVGVSRRLIERGHGVSDALERRTRELNASTRQLAATEKELLHREQLAAVGEISAIVAHELRNPLTILKHSLASLSRGRTSAAWNATVDVMDEETDRMDRLVDDLLVYSRPLNPKPAQVAASELLRAAAERSQQQENRRTTVQVRLRDGGVDCFADPELMCQALCNLLDNAYNAMLEGGTITVEAQDECVDGQRTTLFRISDDGPGIPEPLLKRVQELFFTTRPSGTGLGLAVVDRVISAHGGSVHIESQVGHGTTVSLRVPHPTHQEAP